MKKSVIFVETVAPFCKVLEGLHRATGKTKRRIIEDMILAEAAAYPSLKGAISDAVKTREIKSA